MPDIAGQVLILTVTDVDRSAAWYRELLAMSETGRYVEPEGHVAQVCLVEPGTGLELCLVAHRRSSGAFDEFRAGLDHVEFLVARRDDLDAWASRLDELGIPHSGVKEPSYTANAMVTFRDPDNIQLEFFWRAGLRPGIADICGRSGAYDAGTLFATWC
jgi:glyoxylase I family protein